LVIKAQKLPARLREALSTALAEVGGLLIDRSLPRQAMYDLLAQADCYVSLHRAEGFGLGMAEAMALGKPVIATDYSANTDFMTAANSYPVRYSLRALAADDLRYEPEAAKAYQPGQTFAEPDIDHAAALMRQVYDDQSAARARGAQAAADIAAHCGPRAVVEKVVARVTAIEEALAARPLDTRARDLALALPQAHSAALRAWEATHDGAGAVRGRLGGLRRLLRRVRALGPLSEGQRALNKLALAEAEANGRLIAALAERVARLERAMVDDQP
jgi:hypothetical protein